MISTIAVMVSSFIVLSPKYDRNRNNGNDGDCKPINPPGEYPAFREIVVGGGFDRIDIRQLVWGVVSGAHGVLFCRYAA